MRSNRPPRSFAAWRKFAVQVVITTVILAFGLSVAAIGPDYAHAKRKSKSRSASVVKKPKRHLVINVSLRRQRVTVYDGVKVIDSAPVSSGSSGRETPKGIFSILEKQREHYSNLYNDAPMPFMQRITWSGIALHHGRLPGYAASHGCIRLPLSFSKRLFKMTSRGGRVIVSRDPVKPRHFNHERLFKPLPSLEAIAAAEAARESVAQSGEPAADAQADMAGTKTATQGQSATSGSQTNPPPTGEPTGSQTVSSAAAAAPSGTAEINAPPASLIMSTFPGRLNRAQLIAARKAKMDELKTAVTATKDELKTARVMVKARKRELGAAENTEDFVNTQVRKLKRAATKARGRAVKAAKAMAYFEKRIAGKTFDVVADAVIFAKAVAREEELETAYFERAEDAEFARHDADAMKTRLSSDRRAVDKAKKNLDIANETASETSAKLKDAKKALKQARRAERRYHKPIAIFISRRKGRLYVRQGFQAVFDAPVTIEDPETPLGTHVYTALAFIDDESDLSWSVVSPEDGTRRSRRSRRRRNRKNNGGEQRLRPVSATEALERISIPTDARYRIAELIKPGSSLIISDRRQSPETGWGTDFIVSLR